MICSAPLLEGLFLLLQFFYNNSTGYFYKGLIQRKTYQNGVRVYNLSLHRFAFLCESIFVFQKFRFSKVFRDNIIDELLSRSEQIII